MATFGKDLTFTPQRIAKDENCFNKTYLNKEGNTKKPL